MSYMSSGAQGKCSAIIHAASASAAAVGGGLAQIPCSDNAIITPIQLAMIVSLGRVFNIDMTESAAKASIASMAGATVGRAVSQVVLGWIPGIGNAINASTAAAVTESIGWLMASDFARQSHAA